MNIGQFLIIFWARRVLILAATLSCLVGALIVTAILPPRWQSTARVMLDYIKPDPVTGQVIAGASTRAYVATQTQLVTDYTVAGQVAEQMNWLSDPALIAQWRQRPANDLRDYKRWLADLVIANTKASLVEGSNILEITYTASKPAEAKSAAEAVRKGYIDATLNFRHQDAERNAAWYSGQLEKAKQALDAAVATEASYERANGLVMQQNKLDAESARLQALTQQGAPLSTPVLPTGDSSTAATQLASVQAQLAAQLKILGPNNPEIQDLQSKKAALSELVARDKADARKAAAQISSGGAVALEHAVSAQKAKVVAQSEQIGKLNELHQDVELRRAEYDHIQAKLVQYREQASSTEDSTNAAEDNVTPLGTAATPKAPVFPNYFLIVPGAIGLGLAVGVLVSLLMEFFGRRVRSADDLNIDPETPLICVIPDVGSKRGGRPTGAKLRRRWLSANRGAVGA